MNVYEVAVNTIVSKLIGTEEDPINLATLGVGAAKVDDLKSTYKVLKPSEKVRVIVSPSHARFGTPETPSNTLIGMGAQQRDLYFSVVVTSTTLWGEWGVFEIGYMCERWLVGLEHPWGWEFSIAETLLEDEPDTKSGNTFHFTIILKLADLDITPLDNVRGPKPPVDALLQQIIYDDENNEVVALVPDPIEEDLYMTNGSNQMFDMGDDNVLIT